MTPLTYQATRGLLGEYSGVHQGHRREYGVDRCCDASQSATIERACVFVVVPSSHYRRFAKSHQRAFVRVFVRNVNKRDKRKSQGIAPLG